MLVLPPIDVGSYLCGSVTAKSRRKQHWESSSGEIQGEIKVKLDFFFSFLFLRMQYKPNAKSIFSLHSKVIPYAFMSFLYLHKTLEGCTDIIHIDNTTSIQNILSSNIPNNNYSNNTNNKFYLKCIIRPVLLFPCTHPPSHSTIS